MLGNNIVIYENVNIVDKAVEPSGEAIIGDWCMLCAGCMIIGDVTIGNNCFIGAGAIVTKDVPDNSTVTGVNNIRPNRYDNKTMLLDKIKTNDGRRCLFYDSGMFD